MTFSSSLSSPPSKSSIVTVTSSLSEEEEEVLLSVSAKELSSSESYTSLCSKFGIQFVLCSEIDCGWDELRESDELVKEIRRRYKDDEEVLNMFKGDQGYCGFDDDMRSNPIMLDVFDDMGSGVFNTKGAYWKFKKYTIPIEYRQWKKIHRDEDYPDREIAEVDFDQAYIDMMNDVLDRQDVDDTRTVGDLRSLRQRIEHDRHNWRTDVKKRMGESILPLIKARLYETNRGVGDEIWNELALLDIPNMVRLLQCPKQLDSVLIGKAETKFDTLAEQIRDVLVASEDIAILFDVIRQNSKTSTKSGNALPSKVLPFLDEAIKWGEIAIGFSAKDYGKDMRTQILQKRIAPLLKAYAPSLTREIAYEMEWTWGRRDPKILYKISHEILLNELEKLLFKRLDDIVAEKIESLDTWPSPLLTRRCRFSCGCPQRKLRKPFFAHFTEDEDEERGMWGEGNERIHANNNYLVESSNSSQPGSW